MSEDEQKWRRPIVGIAMPSSWEHRFANKRPPFDATTFADAAEETGISAYVFALRDVDTKARTIKGWVRDGGHWHKRDVPWPDVYYEIPAMEASSSGRRMIRELRRTTIPINTVRRIGKWQAFRILASDPRTKKFLPHTVRYHHGDDLVNMLGKYGMVFIKPEGGQEGKGISRVTLQSNHLYTWEHAVDRIKETNLTLDQVIKRIKETAWHGPMVIQQAIELWRLGSHPADMRILMQKNRSGEWKVSFAKLRVAGDKRFITHANRGGSWYFFPQGLRLIFPKQADFEGQYARLRATAMTIVRILEGHLGPMGEIGLDMTFDRDYRLWFFEANANPAKITGRRRRAGDPAPRWYSRQMEYALYLWKKRGKKAASHLRRHSHADGGSQAGSVPHSPSPSRPPTLPSPAGLVNNGAQPWFWRRY